MGRSHEISRERQRITGCLTMIARLGEAVVRERACLVRGSFYAYRRRCGKRGCKCAAGRLHAGRAFAVSEGGRSRVMPVRGIDLGRLQLGVAAWREHRKARAQMVRAFGELLDAVDRLGGLKVVPAAALRRAGGGPG